MADVAAWGAVRPREEIEAGQARVQDELAEILDRGYSGEEYVRGILAALGWALGQGAAPMIAQDDVDLTNPYALDHERLLATDMLYGRAELDRRGRNYVVGVEHALLWVRHQNASPL